MGKIKLTPHQRRLKARRKEDRLTETVKREAAIDAVSILYVMLIYTMYFFYGWRTEELSILVERFNQIYSAIVNGERTLKQLADEIKHETNIDIDMREGSVFLPD